MIDNKHRIERMQQLLTAAMEITYIEIIDDSHLHVGHAGAASGAGHFTLVIASPEFSNGSQVQNHRKIYQALSEMMTTDIHALSIQIKT